MEYLKFNSLKTALISLKSAKELVSSDPLVLNELGCTYFKEKDYSKAKMCFNEALSLCLSDAVPWLKAIILNNLGGVHRKNREFTFAIWCYESSLVLSPEDPSVLFALGFSFHLNKQLEKAIALYH